MDNDVVEVPIIGEREFNDEFVDITNVANYLYRQGLDSLAIAAEKSRNRLAYMAKQSGYSIPDCSVNK